MGLGVRGAAIATVISQGLSAAFCLRFLTSEKADLRIRRSQVLHPDRALSGKIIWLGFSMFITHFTNSLVTIICNRMLSIYGGDLYISIYAILSSVRQVFDVPTGAITEGSSPVVSYNYGAGNSDRVRQAQKYIIGLCVAYTALLFVLARVAGATFVGLFTTDAVLNIKACRAIRICTLAAIPLGIQYAVVDGFTGMGQVQVSLPLSVWRKTVYFVAVFLLPVFLGADMIFYAEPIADILGPMVAVPVQLVMGRRVLRQREAELRRI
jgi:Na+-driven multidrug efflux pump